MKKYITKAFLATIILAGIASCQKEEDRVFDESVAERLSEQEKKLQDLLLSSEYGWKLVYNTSEGDFGSYTYLMRFKDTRNVEMVSDFDASGPISEVTEYAIHQRTTASLVFTTRSKIHQLSDPANSPYAAGKGYYGEYQFGYYGNTENEIYFRTPKQDQELTFVKATKEDWDNFKTQSSMVDHMNFSLNAYFRVVEIEKGSKKEIYDFVNKEVVRMIDMDGNPLFNESDYGLTFNPKGFTVSPIMEVEGQKISSFLYDEINDSFIGREGDVKVTFKFSKSPAIWTDMSYKKLLVLPNNRMSSFTFRTNSSYQLFNSSVTSPYLKQEVAAMGKDAVGQYNLASIDLTFNANVGLPFNANYVRYTYKGKQYLYFFRLEDLKDRVKVIAISWNSPATVPNEIKELNDKFLGEELYVRNESFRIQYGLNPVGTFISTKSPIAFPTWDVSEPYVFN
ncbi:DUF4302 domain-containing protein [Myroides sp. C4067]|uniref:DUF4302 domain-containing protein n=1 Tax=Myroides sp. C4067 TaxID=3136765 RepID=UPI003101A036